MQQQVQDEMEVDTDIVSQASGRSAAGRKGGLATKARKGVNFYRDIGRKGGQSRGKR